MTDKELFKEENERIAQIIKEGRFLTAEEGKSLGEAIAEGFVKGFEMFKNQSK